MTRPEASARPLSTGRNVTTAFKTWQRRARPLLGTLVEVGLPGTGGDSTVDLAAGFENAFAAIVDVQRCLSRFDPDSDVSRFHACAAGGALSVRAHTQAVLRAAHELQTATAGAFDISLGTGPQSWRLEGDLLHKFDESVRLDLGGIGKGHAVDAAVQALCDEGWPAGWVNAGGDLRAFGDVELPVHLRDEASGGVRPFAQLHRGAWATSDFGDRTRSALAVPQTDASPPRAARAHVSVAAPLCLWADALTKVVALRGDPCDPLLHRYDAMAWIH